MILLGLSVYASYQESLEITWESRWIIQNTPISGSAHPVWHYGHTKTEHTPLFVGRYHQFTAMKRGDLILELL